MQYQYCLQPYDSISEQHIVLRVRRTSNKLETKVHEKETFSQNLFYFIPSIFIWHKALRSYLRDHEEGINLLLYYHTLAY